MDVRWVRHLAYVRAVVNELDLFDFDGGVAAHDITSPFDSLPKDALHRWVRSLLVVEQLRGEVRQLVEATVARFCKTVIKPSLASVNENII